MQTSKDADNKTIHWSDEMKSVFESQSVIKLNLNDVAKNMTEPDVKSPNDRKIFSEEHELKTRNAQTSISHLNLPFSEQGQPPKPDLSGAIDIRYGQFAAEALKMPANELRDLLMRDDIICNTEQDVLHLVLTYIKTKVQEQFDAVRSELIQCIRFD